MKPNLISAVVFFLSALGAWISIAGGQALADAPPPGQAARQQADVPQDAVPASPKPTLVDVAYGTDPRQVLDFWKAESSSPTPLVFYIHGGGWVGGARSKVYEHGLTNYLAAGISVVSIEFRTITSAQAAGVKPPLQWPLQDAARALQFVRSKSTEWNIAKLRIGASGGSAGGCSSLWLAFHNDMADSRSPNPVARESTRLYCAGVLSPQTTLDPQQMRAWTPNSNYGNNAFGINSFQRFLETREQILPWIKAYSPYELVSSDDPPIYMIYDTPPALGQEQKDTAHTANFGVRLQEKLRSVGVDCEFVYPGAPAVKYAQVWDYLITKLKEPLGP